MVDFEVGDRVVARDGAAGGRRGRAAVARRQYPGAPACVEVLLDEESIHGLGREFVVARADLAPIDEREGEER